MQVVLLLVQMVQGPLLMQWVPQVLPHLLWVQGH
jgi:hypothetical protein